MGNDISFPEEIREQIKDEEPTFRMQLKLKRLYQIAKEVNTFECPKKESFIIYPDGLSYAKQHQNACVLRSSFSSFDQSPEGLFFGDSTIRKVLSNFNNLTTSKDSGFGIVATSGLQKAHPPDPFMVVKYYFDTNPIPFLFEIVVGMILNDARRTIPNVMFTYGGIYCSAPVNARRTYRQILEKNLDHYKDDLMDLIESHFQSFKDVEWEKLIYNKFEQICIRFVTQEYPFDQSRLQNINNVIENISHQIEKAFYSLGYNIQKKPFYEIESRPKDFDVDKEDRLSRDEEQFWIQVLNKIRDKKNTFSRELYNQLKKMQQDLSLKVKKVQDFNPQLMCNPDRSLSVILFMEKIPNSKRLEEYLENYKELSFPDVSKMINIWSQLVFTIAFLWKNYECSHNDLHYRNILIRAIKVPIDIVYPLGELITIRVNCIATLIDFGLSTVVYEKEIVGYIEETIQNRHENDLNSLHEMFSEYYDDIRERFLSLSLSNEVTLRRLKTLIDLEPLIKKDANKYIQSFYSIVKEFDQ
jgi:hypothetical protein